MPIQRGYGVYYGGVGGNIPSSGVFGGGGIGFGSQMQRGQGMPPMMQQQNPLMMMQQSMQQQQMYQQNQAMAFAQQRDTQNYLRTPEGQQAWRQHQEGMAQQQQASIAHRKAKGKSMYDQAKANRRPVKTQLAGTGPSTGSGRRGKTTAAAKGGAAKGGGRAGAGAHPKEVNNFNQMDPENLRIGGAGVGRGGRAGAGKGSGKE